MTARRRVTLLAVLGVASLAAAAELARQKPVRDACGHVKGEPVSLDQALCIARSIEMENGVKPWKTSEELDETFAEHVWSIQNTVQESADGCGTWGMALEVSKLDGRVLSYTPWRTVCMHDEKKREPLVRPTNG